MEKLKKEQIKEDLKNVIEATIAYLEIVKFILENEDKNELLGKGEENERN